MTRRVSLPTTDDIAAIVDTLGRENPALPPTVVAVADKLGMSNGTFWRHFPQIAQTLADTRRAARSGHPRPAPAGADENLRADLVRLRTDKTRLEADVRVAAGEIQRLTLENHALRIELEQAVGISTIRVLPPA